MLSKHYERLVAPLAHGAADINIDFAIPGCRLRNVPQYCKSESIVR